MQIIFSKNGLSGGRCIVKSMAMIGIIMLMPSSVFAKYVDIGVSSDSAMFCGLLENGSVKCYTRWYREPALINGDPSQTYTEIGVGEFFACGITTAQNVTCWGDNVSNILAVPVFDFPVVRLSVSGYYACAIDSATNVKCWGQNVHGQSTPPAQASGFVEITTYFHYACGLKSDGSLVCWGENPNPGETLSDIERVPSSVSDLTNINFARFLRCGIHSDGNASCWNSAGSVRARFDNGPYRQVLAEIAYDSKIACALTLNGEIDCTSAVGPNQDAAASMLDIERRDGTYVAVDRGLGESLCGYTNANRLECYRGNLAFSRTTLDIIDLVNGDWMMPRVELNRGEYYGEALEIFFNLQIQMQSDSLTYYGVEIFRDGELLVRSQNSKSYVDNTIEADRDYIYTVRPVHLHGQIGDFSNVVNVSTTLTETDLSDNPQPTRAQEPVGLRAEVYWYDVELFWDRNTSGLVRNYEIRRDGELVATTRGTSWYDDSTAEGGRYVYDVIAVGFGSQILGFRSVPVSIGALQCE